jgi:putative intracellular protease/amidase
MSITQGRGGESLMAKILFVLTGTSYWTLKDGTRHPTGYWAEEFTAPYSALNAAGHKIVVATPGGVVPYVDVMSLRPSMAGGEESALAEEGILRSAEELRRPIELANARLEDFDAVYFPGGHGPMEDLWKDADAGRLLTAALASGKPLAIVCHAPAAMLATRWKGVSPFAGYRVTAYTNDEEEAVGLASKASWLLEDELVNLGVDFTRGESWQPYTVVDRNLYTGQNPASAAPLAQELLKALG